MWLLVLAFNYDECMHFVRVSCLGCFVSLANDMPEKVCACHCHPIAGNYKFSLANGEKKCHSLFAFFYVIIDLFSKRSFLSLFILSAIPLFWGGFLLFLFLSLHLIYHNFILLSSDSPETIPILGRVDDLILVLLLLHTQSLLIIPLCLASSILSLLINHFGTQGDSDQPGLFCFSSGYRPSTMLWLCSVSLACCLAYVLVLMCYCFV